MNSTEIALTEAVLKHGPVPRSALTGLLGLSPASLTRLSQPLLRSGLLVELSETVDGSVGRPSRPLEIAPTLGQFIGIKLTGDRIHAVLTDVRASTLETFEAELSSTSPDDVVESIATAVDELRTEKVLGLGVSLGGLCRDGRVISASFLQWHDVDLASLLVDRLEMPAIVENDLVALAEAEHWFGPARSLDSFAVVTIGAGVGSALVMHDRAVRTADAGVGTVGHIPLDPLGPLCSEGHRGCAQAMLTTGSLTAQVSRALDRPVTWEQLTHMYIEQVPAARSVIDAAATALGTLMGLVTNISLLSTLVLAGEGIAVYELATEHVERSLRESRSVEAEPITVHVDRSGFTAWARGAAAMAVQDAVRRLATAPPK